MPPRPGDIKRWCSLTSDVCLSVAYIGPKSKTERPRKTTIGIEVAHVTGDSGTTLKVKRSKVKVTRPLCTGRPTWTYSNGHLSICVHDVYRVITCRPGRGHIVAAARLQLVLMAVQQMTVVCCVWRWTNCSATKWPRVTMTKQRAKSDDVIVEMVTTVPSNMSRKLSNFGDSYSLTGNRIEGKRKKETQFEKMPYNDDSITMFVCIVGLG